MISVTLLGTPLDAAIEPTVSAIIARRFGCYREEKSAWWAIMPCHDSCIRLIDRLTQSGRKAFALVLTANIYQP